MKRDLAAIVFASLMPLVMAWLGFVVMGGDADRQGWLGMIYGAGKLVQFPFPVVYILLTNPEMLRRMSFGLAGLGLGVGFGLLVDAAMVGVYLAVLHDVLVAGGTPAKIFAVLEGFHLATPLGFLFVGLFFCVVHSLLEEYYWRWFVFGMMRKWMPVAPAIARSSIAFMLHHIVILYVYFPGRFWTLAMPFSIGVGIGGAVWAWIYHRTGSLLGPWMSHLLIDAGIFVVGYDLLRGMWS